MQNRRWGYFKGIGNHSPVQLKQKYDKVLVSRCAIKVNIQQTEKIYSGSKVVSNFQFESHICRCSKFQEENSN